MIICQRELFSIINFLKHIEKQKDKTGTIKMLFSMLGDKDIELVVQRLIAADLPISEWFIAEIDHPRAATVEQLQNALTGYVDPCQIHTLPDLQQATQAVIDNSQAEDLIVVCGSFHTIGEALSALHVE